MAMAGQVVNIQDTLCPDKINKMSILVSLSACKQNIVITGIWLITRILKSMETLNHKLSLMNCGIVTLECTCALREVC